MYSSQHGSENFRLYDAAYLKDQKNMFVHSPLLNQKNLIYINGNGVSSNITQCINSTIGEFMERSTMYANNLFFNDITINGTSLLTSKSIKLTYKQIWEKKLFVDTCGLSSHVKSDLCLENSLNEFIERQSFIYNYLSKSKGIRIGKNIYRNFIYISEELADIDFFNISLISQYYVILAILKKKDDIWLGLGSGNSLNKALNKAVKEIQQFCVLRKTQSKESANYNKGDYSDLYNRLSSDDIYNAYSYLYDSPYYTDSMYIHDVVPYKNILQELYNQCRIEPYVFFMQMNTINWFKVCQVIDLNWFPSLNPKLFPDEVYEFVMKQMNTDLNSKCNFIPFP